MIYFYKGEGERGEFGLAVGVRIGDEIDAYRTCRFFRNAGDRPKNFGGHRCQTAIKNYNLFSVYTIGRVEPSRVKLKQKGENFQRFTTKLLKTGKNRQN